MNVLWVFAHPERASLNAALRDEGIRALTEAGHAHRQSDLYAMKWKPAVDADDFTDESGDRLLVGPASALAYRNGTLSPDIVAEHEKLDWADTVVFQFPLWWYGTPAILKGWFDRVFVKGLAFGIQDPDHPHRTVRYGDGKLTGKRALVVVTTGSGPVPFGPRGVNGQLDQLLFPLLHGTLWYTGMTVLPPVVVYAADRVSEDQYADAARLVRDRVLAAPTAEPIPFRYQNRGDYDDDLVLRPELEPGADGLGVHYRT